VQYEFPRIEFLSDVLPHIQGKDEFIVAERDYGIIVNYVVSMADTFDMEGPNDLAGAIRRECRGLIFYPDGSIMSRPFHKFFNIGEREETLPHSVDIMQQHVVMEKLDGSMIRPVIANGQLRLGTKMGITEVSMNAEAWLAKQTSVLRDWLQEMVDSGITPLFEWVSRKNQIVLDYEEENLILTAARETITGKYLDIQSLNTPFDVVPVYGSVEGNLNEYLSRAREKEGREGDVIRFANGHMFKVKNDWYVRIHKVLDRVRFDRHIVELILTEKLDDALPLLPLGEVERINEFATAFSKSLHQKIETYDRYWNTVVSNGLDRKRYAQEWMPTIKENDSFAPTYIFGRFNGKDGRTMILDYIEKHTSTNTKWETCARWMNLPINNQTE
jgi:RNA ligase